MPYFVARQRQIIGRSATRCRNGAAAVHGRKVGTHWRFPNIAHYNTRSREEKWVSYPSHVRDYIKILWDSLGCCHTGTSRLIRYSSIFLLTLQSLSLSTINIKLWTGRTVYEAIYGIATCQPTSSLVPRPDWRTVGSGYETSLLSRCLYKSILKLPINIIILCVVLVFDSPKRSIPIDRWNPLKLVCSSLRWCSQQYRYRETSAQYWVLNSCMHNRIPRTTVYTL